MGQQWSPNKAFSLPLLLALVNEIDKRVGVTDDAKEVNRWVVLHAFCVVTYVLSLRGPEGFLLDLDGLHTFWNEADKKKIIITLLGRVKGERHDRWHTLPCTPVTSSGIDVTRSVKRLMELKSEQGFCRGPAISDVNGDVFTGKVLDAAMLEVLEELFDANRPLFPENIRTVEELRKAYHCFRSFRRSSDTRALEKQVGTDDIKIVNRWSTVDKMEGRRPNQEMHFYYADIALLEAPFLRYTYAM